MNTTSERQVAANRRNAQRSTGPRTAAGKRRANRNAYRHGLAAISGGEAMKHIQELAYELINDPANPTIFQYALTAAHAEFQLARIKLIRTSWIYRAYERGEVEYEAEHIRRWGQGLKNSGIYTPFISSAQTMPDEGPDRLAEAIRRALPELAKLDRYEARAATRRNRAFVALAAYQGRTDAMVV